MTAKLGHVEYNPKLCPVLPVSVGITRSPLQRKVAAFILVFGYDKWNCVQITSLNGAILSCVVFKNKTYSI